MSNIFDRLQKKVEQQEASEKPGGISPLDIASLPPKPKKLMRLLLREHEMTLKELREAVQEGDDLGDMTEEDLLTSLKDLTRQFMLTERGEGERRSYMVNLRWRKGGQGIWQILQEKLERDQE
jgi:hypothetical protein